MIRYLYFNICKSDNSSRYFELTIEQDGVYWETAYGNRGIYLDSNIQTYHSNKTGADEISRLIEPLKIYAWPQALPSDYVPRKQLMGCDTNSWIIEYYEDGKQTMRHIKGKGSFPVESPYFNFLVSLDNISPTEDLISWIYSDDT